MTAAPPDLSDLYRRLGCKPLNRSPVAGEIVLVLGGLALFVLGGYLTLAGHRRHLYQSANERTAYLAEILRHDKDKGVPA